MSFDQVLTAPNDPKLNIKYAEAQAKAGHLLAAAAALERLLLTDPNQADARLLYAAVLYRLDDVQNAAEQLKHVDMGSLTPLQKAEAQRYQRLIDGRRARGVSGTQIGGQVAAGVAYDTDAAGALLTQLDEIGLTKLKKEAGTGAIVSGDIHASVPVGPGEKTTVIGALSGYDRETVGGGQDQLQTFAGQLGLGYAETQHSFSVVGVARTYRVLDHHYLDEFGGRAETHWRPDTATTVVISVEGVEQDYHLPPTLPGVNDNGARYDVEVDAVHRFTARSSVLAGLGYETKQAGYKPLGYQAPYLRGRWDWALPRGTYFAASGDVWFLQYDGPDALLLGAERHETRADARLAYGAPFSAFWRQGATGDVRENLVIEFAALYATRDSTQPVDGYQDYGAEARVIWRFGAHQ